MGMIRVNPFGDGPVVDGTAYVDASAVVIGNVVIGAGVYVGPYAVIRADECDEEGRVHSIEIGAGCSVQDGVIIHALGGTRVVIGERTSLAHGCVVHGPCTVGAKCFVGFRAVVYDAALGDGAFVSAGAVVQGVELAADAFVPVGAAVACSEDAERVVSTVSARDREFVKNVIKANAALAEGYNCIERQVLDT